MVDDEAAIRALFWAEVAEHRDPEATTRAEMVRLATLATGIAPESDYVVKGMLKGGRPPSR